MGSENEPVFKPIEQFDTNRISGSVILRSRHYEKDTVMKCALVKHCHAAEEFREVEENDAML